MNSISEIREEYARLCAQLGSLVANRERLDDGIKDLKSRILQLDVNYQALVNQAKATDATTNVADIAADKTDSPQTHPPIV